LNDDMIVQNCSFDGRERDSQEFQKKLKVSFLQGKIYKVIMRIGMIRKVNNTLCLSIGNLAFARKRGHIDLTVTCVPISLAYLSSM
jgi:hypothetical protein